MLEELTAHYQELLSYVTPFAVFLLSFSFMYAALGRSKIFHFERIPRLILSFVLSLYSAHLVQVNAWENIVMIGATAIASGIVAVLIYHVALHRGKTKQESTEVIEDENR